MYKLEDWGLRRGDFITAPSQYVIEETRKLFPVVQEKAMQLLYNAVPVPPVLECRILCRQH